MSEKILQPHSIEYYPPNNRPNELVEELLVIWEDSVRQSHFFLDEDDILDLRPKVREVIKKFQKLAVLVNPEGLKVGFILIEGPKIEALFLAAKFWGQGLGRQLMEWALSQDAYLLDVNIDNRKALKFYQHFGFKIFSAEMTAFPFPVYNMVRQKT
ncbi:MAG: GNAT family N-acetyltransferase [Deltaproteobacteria bacterium]|jgi:putative acetyltransferase|nr:GNAT family N-acetyltransferase [Deltaproteobacteria bacterium]